MENIRGGIIEKTIHRENSKNHHVLECEKKDEFDQRLAYDTRGKAVY